MKNSMIFFIFMLFNPLITVSMESKKQHIFGLKIEEVRSMGKDLNNIITTIFNSDKGSALDQFLDISKDSSFYIDITSEVRPMTTIIFKQGVLTVYYPHRNEVALLESLKLHEALKDSSLLVAQVYKDLAEKANATEYGSFVEKYKNIALNVHGFGTLRRTQENEKLY